MNEYEQIEYGPVEPVIVRREPLPTIANLQSRIEELERENEALRAQLKRWRRAGGDTGE